MQAQKQKNLQVCADVRWSWPAGLENLHLSPPSTYRRETVSDAKKSLSHSFAPKGKYREKRIRRRRPIETLSTGLRAGNSRAGRKKKKKGQRGKTSAFSTSRRPFCSGGDMTDELACSRIDRGGSRTISRAPREGPQPQKRYRKGHHLSVARRAVWSRSSARCPRRETERLRG